MTTQLQYRGFLARVLVFALLALAVGCVMVPTEEPPAQTTGVVIATPPAATHDVALTAIQFDPNPSTQTSLPKGATLLAVIENKGNQTERNLVVEATIFGTDDDDILAQRWASVATLVPGESTVVRLGDGADLPLRPRYLLSVQVAPVPGETLLANNVKSYEIKVSLLQQ